MTMNTKEYQEFMDRWLKDVELTMSTFRVSDLAAVVLLVGDRMIKSLDDLSRSAREGAKAAHEYLVERGLYED